MSRLQKTMLGLTLLLGVLAGSQLSAYLLLWRLKLPWTGVTPLTYLQYWSAHAVHPQFGSVVRSSGALGFGVVVLALALLALVLLFRRPQRLYGDARFASLSDLRGRHMLKPDDTALVVGCKGGKYVYFNGQQFALLAAPTRSGKGVGIVIPNLLSYQGSVVVLDIKRENFDLTSGFRARYGQEVHLFNPFAEDRCTHRWNPLSYVSADPNLRVSDLQAIAAMLYPATDLHKDPFWANQAQNAFVAFALHAFEQADHVGRQFPGKPYETPTMGALYRLASGRPEQPLRDHLRDLASSPNLSPAARTAFGTLLGQADETFASIMGTFKEPLNPWLNPVVDAATSGNDFDLRDVRKKKMSIYVAVQPNKLAEARLIINLFFSQLINENTRELPQANPALKHQCLLLMDEFTSIGRLDIIARAVSFMAGYNLRLMPIIQSLSQLEATYGREMARTLVTNHALRIIFAPREQQDANEYSEMLGYTSVRKQSLSRSRARETSRTLTENEERRALMLPQEIKALGEDKQILLVEGLAHPVMSDKIRYHLDAEFKRRVLPKVEVPELMLGGSTSFPSTTAKSRATQTSNGGLPPESVMQIQAKDDSVFTRAFSGRKKATQVTGIPPEYTGLKGVVGEFDRVVDHLKGTA